MRIPSGRTTSLGHALLALAVVSGVGCAGGHHDGTADEAPAPAAVPKAPDAGASSSTIKPGAPVTVRSTVGDTSARLELAFAASGQDVQVELNGTDGLVVHGDPVPVRGRSVRDGEVLVLDVGFTPGEPHSNLGVLVSGIFSGERQSRAASVTVGEAGRVHAESRPMTDGDGRPLVVGRGEIR